MSGLALELAIAAGVVIRLALTMTPASHQALQVHRYHVKSNLTGGPLEDFAFEWLDIPGDEGRFQAVS